MGNSEPENQKFNSDFNMAEYNLKLGQIRHNYQQNTQLNQVPGAYSRPKAGLKMLECHELTRTTYLYKPSIEINTRQNGRLELQFEYHCEQETELDIALGVRRIDYHETTKQTFNVDCIRSFREVLALGDKIKFKKQYQLGDNQCSQLLKLGILIKISSVAEASEYSLNYNRNTKLWKVSVENYRRGDKVIGIEDIYGGGTEGQECVICFTEKSNTMIKPCNHVCLCTQCSQFVQKQSQNCPICRKIIISFVKIHTTTA